MSSDCNRRPSVWTAFALAASLSVPLSATLTAQVYEEPLPLDDPAIRYWDDDLDDSVARLQKRLERGALRLDFDENGLSYLPSLLEHLDVSPDSQTLVFSKSSLQRSRISPRTPRAVYFNDDLAIGFVPGGESLELAAVEPTKGVVFYSLATAKTKEPRFERPELCLECHHGPATLGVPGVYVGSVAASPTGRADFRLGSIVSDHRTPFEERWGGWYVDGPHGALGHRGNAVAADPAFATVLPLELEASNYPSPGSDVVALMTLEHQTQMINLFTRLGWEARLAAAEGGDVDSARVEEVLAYMLFVDEEPLEAPMGGASSFAASFSARGRRDEKGRSLRDFDLEARLFRYPLSYMIESLAFERLPAAVRDRLYRRLHDVLSATEGDERSLGLAKEDRTAILEILRETKPDLPPYFR